MPIDAICQCEQSRDRLVLSNPWIRLAIHPQNGRWEELVYLPRNLSLLAGTGRPPVEIGLDRKWLPGQTAWQVKDAVITTEDKACSCSLLLGCPQIEVWDRYTLPADEPLIARKIQVIYTGEEKKSFWGALFRLPAVSLGDAADCVVLVPGQSTLSRIPFSEQARLDQYPQPLDDLKYRQGIGRTPYGPLETTPDFTPGVAGIHNSPQQITLLSWFFSKGDCASMATEGSAEALAVTFHHRVEGWAHVDREYECGTQYIAIKEGEVGDALDFVRSSWPVLAELHSPEQRIDPGNMMIYETSAQMEGGISRLAEKLPGLREMGVDTIYLLPLWLGTEVTAEGFAADRALDYRLDARWQRKRVPHRIISHDVLDPDAGTAEEIRQFVAQAHSHKIRVLFDFVFHGVAPESALIAKKPDWFQRNMKGEMFPSHQWLPSYSLDWANPEVQEYFIEFALRNVRDFDIDGYRIDAPFQKESNWKEGLAWRSGASGFGGVRILEAIRKRLKEVKAESVLLCEQSGPIWDGICDLCNDDAFLRMALKVAQAQMEAAALQTWLNDRLAVGVPGSLRVLSIENHNSTRVNPSSLAYRGSPIADALFSICCFAGGIPSIWSGQERGREQFYAELARLRREHPALQHGNVNLDATADSADIFTVLRLSAEENLAAVINCGARWDRVEVKLPSESGVDRLREIWNNAEGEGSDAAYRADRHSLVCTVEPYAAYLIRLEQTL